MRRIRSALLPVLLGAWLGGCGGDDICLYCDIIPTPTPGPENYVTVEGTVTSRSTFDPLDSIVAIGCVDAEPPPADPTDWNACDSQQSASVDDSGVFEITRLAPGYLRVAFWIGTSTIQPDDLFAELSAPEDQVEKLDDVQEGETVSLSQVDIDFGTGIATADISVEDSSTPGDLPAATPTPNPES